MTTMNMHRYEVIAGRRVWRPDAGSSAYCVDFLEREFPYGRGKEFPNGTAAHKAATEFAEKISPLATTVNIWKCHGYGGRGQSVKNSDTLFAGEWKDVL